MKFRMVNPITRLTAGGILDILSMTMTHGVKISISGCPEGEYYTLSAIKGNCVEKVRITNTELDYAKDDERLFRDKLLYAVHRVTTAYEHETKKRGDS